MASAAYLPSRQWTDARSQPAATAALLTLSVAGLEITGAQPILLNALVMEGRLSPAALGWAATAELIAIGLAMAIAGAVLKPHRLRMIAAMTASLMIMANLAGIGLSGGAIIADRVVAGLAEGLLLWLPASMVARSETPALWSGVSLSLQCTAQLLFALLLPPTLMHRFGADGGIAALAGIGVIALLAVPFLPSSFADLKTDMECAAATPGNAPSMAGWMALAAIFLITAYGIGLFAYLGPIATSNGLSQNVLALAVSAVLAAEIVGALCAALMSKRLPHYPALLLCAVAHGLVLLILSSGPKAPLFILTGVLFGFFQVFLMPFQLPLAIEADPSRRAAVITPGAQLLGAALGPFLCSFLVTQTSSSGVLIVTATCLAAGMVTASLVHLNCRRAALLPAA